ncbi:cytochrome P450 [Mycena rosella]|uniref:Cytochrome P450 n=1 Tax=Mycena rosella TaxID=1033263 RepID=A0AAD7GS28_MYCRO|nr:cytochrome P450 [Mycena rosella]
MSSPLLNAVLASILLTLFIFGRFVLHLIASRLSLRHVPRPNSTSLLWGEEWNLYHNAPGSYYREWHRKLENIKSDQRAVSFIVGEGIYKFPKPDGVREWFRRNLGKEAHEKQRRSLAPALTQQSVRNSTSIFYETSGRLAARWMKILDDSQLEEVEINVTNWAAFSYDFNFLSVEPNALAEGKMIKVTKAELSAIAGQLLQDAKSSGLNGTSADKTLMGLMRNFSLKADASSAHKMHEHEIISQMRTVLSAGYETVSAIIAKQLRAEISSLGDPSLDELNTHYPVLNSVILETLRLHPPILENHHQRWRHDRNLFAFSDGFRQCIGKRFALGEIKVCLTFAQFLATDGIVQALTVTLIRQFSFGCPHDIQAFQSFVIRPRIKGQGASSLPLSIRRI